VLHGRGLTNVPFVVRRYFGGVLLVSGGLVRAYSNAARLAADAAGVQTMRLWRVLLVPSPYPLLERIRGCIDAHGGVVREADFGTDVLLETLVPETAAEAFLTALADLSAGSVEAETVETVFRGA
ncbi:MAG: YigZ family protein, partial [Planctomycetaceae bacterium]|nr:YigZ family protein [Planctomycetaceae bacterium]